MMITNRIWRDQQGAAALEFALAAPVLITMVVGMAQLGVMYSANTGVHHAVEEGARLATIFPTPTNEEISQRVLSTKFMVSNTATPEVTRGTTSAGEPYIDISLSHTVPLDFIFFSLDPVTVQHSRRVFRQLAAGETGGAGTGTGTGTGTGGDGGGAAPEDPPIVGDTDPEPPPVSEPPPPPVKSPGEPGGGPPPKEKGPSAPSKTPGGLPPGNGKGKK
jgi:Flp pilus assembly protein TadG